MSPIVFLTYDWFWLLVALAFCVPAWFIDVCCEALQRYSRKEVLSRVSDSQRRQQVDESLSWKHEYLGSLGAPLFLFRLGAFVCLAIGRVLQIDEHRIAEVATSATSFGELSAGVLALNASILTAEIIVFATVFLYFLPSLIAKVGSETWLLRFLPVVEWTHRAVEPWRKLSDGMIRIVTILIGKGSSERSSADIVEEEIRSAVGEGQREGLLQTRDIRMIESIMNYGDLEVSEVMTPRTDMVALDLEDPLAENLELVIQCGHSRIPVYHGVRDNIVGLLYVKDLQKFLLRGETIDLAAIVRPPYFADEDAKISGLLQEFKGHRQHLAIVRDEHGGTAGLVTIEDIIEEIVGEIIDEYESEDLSVRRIGRNVVEVDASMHVDDLNEQLDLSIPEGAYDTVGGYVFERMGHMPAVGECHSLNGCQFEVIEADDRRIHRLRLRFGGRTADAKPT